MLEGSSFFPIFSLRESDTCTLNGHQCIINQNLWNNYHRKIVLEFSYLEQQSHILGSFSITSDEFILKSVQLMV